MNSVKPREKRHKRENQFTDIGVRGRKTGVLIRENILQDEDGLDNIDDFFESSSEEEKEVAKVYTQSQSIDVEHTDLETTFEESADMEFSAESGVSPHTYLNQSSVSSIVSHRTKSSPLAKLNNRSSYSVKRAHHVFEESTDSPDIGLVKKKIDFKSKASPIRHTVVTSTPKSSPRGQRLPHNTFDSPSRMSQSMEDSIVSDLDVSLSVLEPEETELDSVLDDSNLSPRTNRRSESIPPEFNEELDQVLSDENLSEDDIQMSPTHHRPSPQKPKTIAKMPKAEPKKPVVKKTIVKAKARARAREDEDEEEEHGVRKSGRTKVKPLDFWRNERIVYGRRKSGPNIVSVVKEIVTVPEEHLPLSKKSKRKVGAKKGKKEDEEEEYDDKPIDKIAVLDWYTGEEVEQVVGLTKGMVVTKPVKNQPFEFEKTFGEAAFMSSGIIKIHPNGLKPKRNSGDNAMVFFVVSGSCKVTVHKSSFDISTGGQFHVPRGNQYQLENIGSNELRLFFSQARETVPAE